MELAKWIASLPPEMAETITTESLSELLGQVWDEGHSTCCDSRCFSEGNPYHRMNAAPFPSPNLAHRPGCYCADCYTSAMGGGK